MRRLGGVPAALGVLLIAALAVAGCTAATMQPTPSTTSTTTPTTAPIATSTPTAAITPAASLLPLPDNIGGIPGPGDPSAELSAQTQLGEIALGESRDFTLGHCGLISPVDIDGSLWDAIGGHNGTGGPLTEDQLGDLINATPTVVTLVDAQTLEMSTSHGAVVTLTRHDGPRRYLLCD